SSPGDRHQSPLPRASCARLQPYHRELLGRVSHGGHRVQHLHGAAACDREGRGRITTTVMETPENSVDTRRSPGRHRWSTADRYRASGRRCSIDVQGGSDAPPGIGTQLCPAGKGLRGARPGGAQITPKAIIASATLRKPATLAPTT